MSEYDGERGRLREENPPENEGEVLVPEEANLDEDAITVDLRHDSEYLSKVISNYEAKLEQGIDTARNVEDLLDYDPETDF